MLARVDQTKSWRLTQLPAIRRSYSVGTFLTISAVVHMPACKCGCHSNSGSYSLCGWWFDCCQMFQYTLSIRIEGTPHATCFRINPSYTGRVLGQPACMYTKRGPKANAKALPTYTNAYLEQSVGLELVLRNVGSAHTAAPLLTHTENGPAG